MIQMNGYTIKKKKTGVVYCNIVIQRVIPEWITKKCIPYELKTSVTNEFDFKMLKSQQ